MPLRIYTGARGSRFVCDDENGFGDAVAEISKRATRGADALVQARPGDRAALPGPAHPAERKVHAAGRAAVKAFQHDHHQKEDGEVGIHALRALRGAGRAQKKEGKGKHT